MFNKSLKNITNYLQLELGNNISEAVRNMIHTTITIPAAPTPTPDHKDPKVIIPPSNIDIFQWKLKFTKALDRFDKYKENMAKAYVIMYHQCTPNLKNELETSDAFPAIHNNQNIIALLCIIQGLCCWYGASLGGTLCFINNPN